MWVYLYNIGFTGNVILKLRFNCLNRRRVCGSLQNIAKRTILIIVIKITEENVVQKSFTVFEEFGIQKDHY